MWIRDVLEIILTTAAAACAIVAFIFVLREERRRTRQHKSTSDKLSDVVAALNAIAQNSDTKD